MYSSICCNRVRTHADHHQMIRGIVVLMLLVVTLTVQAEVDKHALVIGNSSYDPGALKNLVMMQKI